MVGYVGLSSQRGDTKVDAVLSDLPSHLADTFLHADESHAPSLLQCAFEVEPASVISDAEVEAPSGIEPPNHSVAS